jgi:hypothetical protein
MPIVNNTADGHLANSLMPANTAEARCTQGANIKDVTAGQNNGGFELRATQEQGSH